jgi:hypothetical protein
MAKKRALLFIKVNPAGNEAAWNEWYDHKHIPDRLKIKGFLSARRFLNYEDKAGIFTKGEPKYLTLYELADSNVLKSEAFKKLIEAEASLPPDSFEALSRNQPTFRRGIYEQIFPVDEEYQPPSSRYLLIAEQEIPAQYEEEFNAYYNTEHIPAINQVPGFLTARRFKLSMEFPPVPDNKAIRPYITVYDVQDEEVFATEVFKRQSASPWQRRMVSIYAQRLILFYRRVVPKSK